MRRVADELATGPPTLYWNVRSSDELIDLMVDPVASEIQAPEPDPERWEEQLKEWMIDARRVFLRHRGVGQLTLGRIPIGPNLVRSAAHAGLLTRRTCWSMTEMGSPKEVCDGSIMSPPDRRAT